VHLQWEAYLKQERADQVVAEDDHGVGPVVDGSGHDGRVLDAEIGRALLTWGQHSLLGASLNRDPHAEGTADPLGRVGAIVASRNREAHRGGGQLVRRPGLASGLRVVVDGEIVVRGERLHVVLHLRRYQRLQEGQVRLGNAGVGGREPT